MRARGKSGDVGIVGSSADDGICRRCNTLLALYSLHSWWLKQGRRRSQIEVAWKFVTGAVCRNQAGCCLRWHCCCWKEEGRKAWATWPYPGNHQSRYPRKRWTERSLQSRHRASELWVCLKLLPLYPRYLWPLPLDCRPGPFPNSCPCPPPSPPRQSSKALSPDTRTAASKLLHPLSAWQKLYSHVRHLVDPG